MFRRAGKRASEESAAEGLTSSLHFCNPSNHPELQHVNSIIINTGDDNRPHATINILGKEITGLLDSGANCSLLGGTLVDIVDELQLKRGTLKGGIQTADGTKHTIKESANLPIAYN